MEKLSQYRSFLIAGANVLLAIGAVSVGDVSVAVAFGLAALTALGVRAVVANPA